MIEKQRRFARRMAPALLAGAAVLLDMVFVIAAGRAAGEETAPPAAGQEETAPPAAAPQEPPAAEPGASPAPGATPVPPAEPPPRIIRVVCTDRICGGCDGKCRKSSGHVAVDKKGHCSCTPTEGSALDRATRDAYEKRPPE